MNLFYAHPGITSIINVFFINLTVTVPSSGPEPFYQIGPYTTKEKLGNEKLTTKKLMNEYDTRSF